VGTQDAPEQRLHLRLVRVIDPHGDRLPVCGMSRRT